MIKTMVKLDTVEKIKEFVLAISKFTADADLSSQNRRFVVDAKSLLGVFSLDTARPLILIIHDDESQAGKYKALMDKFAA